MEAVARAIPAVAAAAAVRAAMEAAEAQDIVADQVCVIDI